MSVILKNARQDTQTNGSYLNISLAYDILSKTIFHAFDL